LLTRDAAQRMRPILPESIYLRIVSSVGSAAGTPRLSIVLPANQGSIVYGEKAAIRSPISHIAPPTSSVGPPDRHLAACRKVRLNFACLASSGSLRGMKFATTRSPWRRVANNKREHVVPLSDAAKTIMSQFRRHGRQYVFGRRDSGFLDWSKAKTSLDSGRRRSGQVDTT